MINPSKPADAQNDCPLFKLAAETRNEIYALVFAVETKEDGSVQLDDSAIGSDALVRTCQQIYSESRRMHQLAYHDYPTHTFTIDLPNQGEERPFIPALNNDFFRRMTSFRVTWRADENNQGLPLRFTTYFNKDVPLRYYWNLRTELHDEYWRGKEAGDIVEHVYVCRAGGLYKYHVKDPGLLEFFASLVHRAVRAELVTEDWIWLGKRVSPRKWEY